MLKKVKINGLEIPGLVVVSDQGEDHYIYADVVDDKWQWTITYRSASGTYQIGSDLYVSPSAALILVEVLNFVIPYNKGPQ